jgi:formate dehydrogenase subunit gamma
MALLVPVFFLAGIVICDVYFSAYTTIEHRRIAALIHSLAAAAAIIVSIVHVYAAIWVRGSVRTMTKGYVTPGWGVAAPSQMVSAPGSDWLDRATATCRRRRVTRKRQWRRRANGRGIRKAA